MEKWQTTQLISFFSRQNILLGSWLPSDNATMTLISSKQCKTDVLQSVSALISLLTQLSRWCATLTFLADLNLQNQWVLFDSCFSLNPGMTTRRSTVLHPFNKSEHEVWYSLCINYVKCIWCWAKKNPGMMYLLQIDVSMLCHGRSNFQQWQMAVVFMCFTLAVRDLHSSIWYILLTNFANLRIWT